MNPNVTLQGGRGLSDSQPAHATGPSAAPISVGSFNELLQSAEIREKPVQRPTFGAYAIGDLLGQGGCGQVFAAKHRWLDKPVAIKFLILPETDAADAMERFRREAKTGAQLNHPAFVRATDGGIANGRAFLVTDLIDGEDLSSIVERCGPLDIELACEIAASVADALAYLEEREIVHRDLKPSNIMIDREGRVYILDLGLARNVSDSTLTQTGAFMGTVDYLAPEQALNPRTVTNKADMYSLGCTLYFLLTGQTPYHHGDDDSLAARIIAHVEATPEPLDALRPNVPSRVRAVVEAMLEKSPMNRPRSFSSIARKLRSGGDAVDLRAVFGEQTKAKTAEPEYDWIDEMIVKVARCTGRLLLLLLGMIESVPTTRPDAKKHYRFSYRWLKALGWVFGAYALLWFVGVGFEIPGVGISFGAPPPPGYYSG